MGKGTERERQQGWRPTKDRKMRTRTEDEVQDPGEWRRGEYVQANPEEL